MRPDLYAARSVGHVRASSVRKDEATAGVAAQVIVARADAIDRATTRRNLPDGLHDISSGYDCRLDEVSGVVPEGHAGAGQAYDRVQRDIVYNHVALLPRGGGRLGTQCSLRLDSAGAQIVDPDTTQETQTMIRIDGKEYSGDDAAQAAVDAALSAAAQATATQKARADAAETELATIKAAQAAHARTALEVQARGILGADFAFAVKADGKDVPLADRDIKVAVVTKLDSAFKAEGKPDAYIDVRYDIAIEQAAKGPTRSDVSTAIVDLNRRASDKTPEVRADAAEPDINTDPRGYAAYHEARAKTQHARN
jgi:hypothetical protein